MSAPSSVTASPAAFSPMSVLSALGPTLSPSPGFSLPSAEEDGVSSAEENVPSAAGPAAPAAPAATAAAAPAAPSAVVPPAPWVAAPVRFVRIRGRRFRLSNISLCPAIPRAIIAESLPALPGTPREAWDRPVPSIATHEEWASAHFVELPPAAWFRRATRRNPVAVSGLSSWAERQPLSSRERRWMNAPVLRSVL
ncbi:uncharacterized protein LDX57_008645 [Aspergillus melleus]|uniref:uncharacterized protein n=1 Tax=Aspergillus melleus TaxID=138277 RepID=UPI001E8DAA30|nr:uncharacterized protein LDX57_008645 [Aspergillus melleus]KAH8430983.1 hypothetical protein LDX57_008645 [Aspergillus melleus]